MHAAAPTDPTPRPKARTRQDTKRVTGLGLTLIDELCKDGKLRSVKVGRRRLILEESIDALLSAQAA